MVDGLYLWLSEDAEENRLPGEMFVSLTESDALLVKPVRKRIMQQ